jgi:hypothetical protein
MTLLTGWIELTWLTEIDRRYPKLPANNHKRTPQGYPEILI